MTRIKIAALILAGVAALAPVSTVLARGGFRGGGGGFGGGFGGGNIGTGGYTGGGFRGGGFGGGNIGTGGYTGGGFRGGSEFNRTPSFSSNRSFNNGFGGGFNSFNRGAYNGFGGGFNSFNRGAYNGFGLGLNSFNRGAYNGFGGNYGFRGYGYNGYHNNWVNGYWPGRYNNWGSSFGLGGYGLGLGTGLGLGSLSSWAYGPMLYNWGYMGYSNPYYSQPIGTGLPAVFDYADPIDTAAAPPADNLRDEALGTFNTARQAFKTGDYQNALNFANQALKSLPGDAALHQFRALCFFALGQYDEDAGALYAILSDGPGWDWTTLIGLYPDIETYTAQVRALESYIKDNPASSSARFDLAYQYMTQGHADAAVKQFQAVKTLQPQDKISGQLIEQLSPDDKQADVQPPSSPLEGTPGDVDGTWTAKPADQVTIDLTLKKNGPFTWKVDQKGTAKSFSGDSTFGDNLLTLAPSGGGEPMVGKLYWQDPDHFKFQVVGGGGPNDPGLSFSR